MKIKPQHYAYLKRAISCHLENRDALSIETQYRDAGFTPKRFRWDCLHGAKLSKWICDNIYSYCDDSHVDTAMRKIMVELSLNWASKS